MEHGDFIRFDVDMDWSYDLARPMQQSRQQMHRPFTHAMGRSPQALSVQREVFISNAKAFFDGTYHGRGRTRRALYFAEFVYRFNRRYFGSRLPERLLVACEAAYPHPYGL